MTKPAPPSDPTRAWHLDTLAIGEGIERTATLNAMSRSS